MTLLEIVQSCLSVTDSDEVNTITDTVEAQQVAQIVKDTYYELITNLGIPEHDVLLPLSALGDTSKPNYMKIPSNAADVEDVRYDARAYGETDPAWKDVVYMDPVTFLKRVQARKLSDSNVISVTDFNGVVLHIINDYPPSYWTSFDDEYLVFDSYDSAVDSTLQSSKSSVIANVEPSWIEDDDFIPDLDHNFFPLLLAECKSMSFAILKQASNPKVEQKARQQKITTQNDKYRFKEKNLLDGAPNFGRR